jgi:uncharacterized protein YceK
MATAYIKRRHIHSDRIERWLGPEGIYRAQQIMRDGGGEGKRWYGPPINCRDIPGSVWLTKDGDFVGTFERGAFDSAWDSMERYAKRLWRELGKQAHEPVYAAGFASISDALARASSGFRQYPNGTIVKAGSTGVVSVTNSLWRPGSMPTAGGAASAAPGGRAPTQATTGAMTFTNPASGTSHLTGVDMSCSVINNTVLLYDRIFDVAKVMNSAAAEAVTGVPTRYQSTTATNEDYIGGNFLFVEVGGTALAATAHNWTPCAYRDQGDVASTLPSLTGNSAAIVDRLDHPTFSWFAPLESGDSGVKAITNMQCSAAVATGAINFVIGHPIGFMFFPVITALLPFDWLTNKDQAPRIFDSPCLAMMELNKPATTATTYQGRISVTNAAA